MSATDTELWWLLPTFSVTFLLVHYALVGSRQALESSDGRQIRPIVSRAVTAELSLIPLSLAMVLAYRSSGDGLMVLLGATGLFTSMLFRRSILLSHALTKRVRDLSHINESGKLLDHVIPHPEMLRPGILRGIESLNEVYELLSIPTFRLDETRNASCIPIGIMTQSMMTFAVAKPGKYGGAYRMRPLNGSNPRHIACKRTDEKLHL